MRILIIDDEPSIRKTTSICLEALGHECSEASSGLEALKRVEKTGFDVALLDLRLNQEDGLVVLSDLLKAAPRLAVVVMTAYSSIETAVEAMRRGAQDYVPKPFTPEQLNQILVKIARTRQLMRRVEELETRVGPENLMENANSEDHCMKRVYELVDRAASTPATILLLGPSGTGKSVLARHIHQKSREADNSFVTVNCPCLSRDLLESALFGHIKGAFTGAVSDAFGKVAAADGGTLFLDEIGEMPLELQPKLLRLLQEREYERVGEAKTRYANVRLIAATNRNLAKSVEAGTFREDLYYRLNVVSVTMPALGDRRNDLRRMAQDFLKFFATQAGKPARAFSQDSWKLIEAYHWPGNIRELRNAVERSVIMSSGPEVQAADMPEWINESDSRPIQPGSHVSLAELETEHIRRVMASTRSLEEAAKVLDIDPTTLYRKRRRMENGDPQTDHLKTAVHA